MAPLPLQGYQNALCSVPEALEHIFFLQHLRLVRNFLSFSLSHNLEGKFAQSLPSYVNVFCQREEKLFYGLHGLRLFIRHSPKDQTPEQARIMRMQK